MTDLGRRGRRAGAALVVAALVSGSAAVAVAQTVEGITFDEAIRRATMNHPTVQRSAADILRAQAVLTQVRSRTLPSVGATLTTNVIGPVSEFSGTAITPRTQTLTAGAVAVPLMTPVAWAERNQAADQILVSERALVDARRQVAIAAGQAYLSVITERRLLELNQRALENARSHFSLAEQRFQGGIGSRLNAVRARQEVSTSEARVEEARLAIRRAQEALGVLIAADGPADAGEEPAFDLPPAGTSDADFIAARDDLQAVATRERAAIRRSDDAWKDRLPSVTALFTPQWLTSAGLFANARSWRASVLFSVPLFDGGQRRGQARERAAFVDSVRAERLNVERQAGADIRVAREAVAATERALAYAGSAAAEAEEVVRITDTAFREGATTNIEVIDAQRQARDAETAAAIAADAVRRARLELLIATGQFPQ